MGKKTTIGELLKRCRTIKAAVAELEAMIENAAEGFEGTNFVVERRKSPPNLSKKGPPQLSKKKKPSGSVEIPDDLTVTPRAELVDLCHDLGYLPTDTKAKRVSTLRDMVEAKRVAEDTPVKSRPTLTKKAKAKRPRLRKGGK